MAEALTAEFLVLGQSTLPLSYPVYNNFRQLALCCSFSDETNGGNLIEGDSVRLKLSAEELKPKFLERDLDHSSIGYIRHLDGNGGVGAPISTNITIFISCC